MGTKKKTEQCMICGSRLDYLKKAGEMTCVYCRKAELTHISCPNAHYVCDACHSRDVMKAVEDISFSAGSRDPVAIAELMMSHPALPMLGCEHAFIAAGALMAALRNALSGKITQDDIREAFSRTRKQAVGGYCGLSGVCGIVPAIGACVSVFLGSKCGSDTEQKITMEAVTRAAQAVSGLTGPSCCKAYVRASLMVAVQMFEEKFGIVLPLEDQAIACKHSGRHPHGCRTDRCPYYRVSAMDVLADTIHLPVTVCHT